MKCIPMNFWLPNIHITSRSRWRTFFPFSFTYHAFRQGHVLLQLVLPLHLQDAVHHRHQRPLSEIVGQQRQTDSLLFCRLGVQYRLLARRYVGRYGELVVEHFSQQLRILVLVPNRIDDVHGDLVLGEVVVVGDDIAQPVVALLYDGHLPLLQLGQVLKDLVEHQFQFQNVVLEQNKIGIYNVVYFEFNNEKPVRQMTLYVLYTLSSLYEVLRYYSLAACNNKKCDILLK